MKVLAINPNSFEAHYAKAKANKEAGRLHEAVNDLTEALRVAPHNRDLHKVILRIKEEIAADEEKTSSEEESEIESKESPSDDRQENSTSGVDSSTGSGSFNGAGSNERNCEKAKLANSFDQHDTSLII